jgi:BlaI family transcriptional regulator, penicillinase repressor
MTRDPQRNLTRRERQIMDVLYARGRATVAEVQEHIPDAPSYSTVRTLLRLLEEKGQLRHEHDGPRFVYVPMVARDKARRSALRNMLHTFFDGSTEDAVAALLDLHDERKGPVDLARIRTLIAKTQREGR